MGLGHCYCGEIDASVIAWSWREYLGVHGTGFDHFMHDVFHVVSRYVFHGCDCVILCYRLHGKHIYGMMYMGNVIAWLLRRKMK